MTVGDGPVVIDRRRRVSRESCPRACTSMKNPVTCAKLRGYGPLSMSSSLIGSKQRLTAARQDRVHRLCRGCVGAVYPKTGSV